MNSYVRTFGRNTNLVEARDFMEIASEIAKQEAQAVYFCNVHMLMHSQEDRELANAMDNADWVFADGVPVSWLQRRISGKNAQVIRGYEIMLAVCERAAETGDKVGFLGSTEDVMEALTSNLRERFKGLNIVLKYCPAFMKGEMTSTGDELKKINDSQVEWLFVGLGCPKQEKWIARYKDELNCHTLGVGAAFNWISGLESMPPDWMQSSGLGWLYRLIKNPRKLWRRYAIYNSKFLIRFIKTPSAKG